MTQLPDLIQRRDASSQELDAINEQAKLLSQRAHQLVGRISTLNELIQEATPAPTEGQGEGDVPGPDA